MYDITVIVTVYNQPLEAILATLRSIIYQQDVKTEILIADDCSKVAYSQELISFFELNDYSDYRIIKADTNVQTVRNILRALHQANGKYIKVVGAGDMLYDETTLKCLFEWSSNSDVKVGFGKIVRFEKRTVGYRISEFNAPSNANSYRLDQCSDTRELFERQMMWGDWIPGPTQFFEKDYFEVLLTKLSQECGVRYCEDFAATIALLFSNVVFYPRPVEWYEWGVGISTGDGKEARSRLYRDHTSFYKALASKKPYGRSLMLPRVLFNVKKFIALHTPWYSFFRNRLVKSYTQQQEESFSEVPNEFFYKCINSTQD